MPHRTSREVAEEGKTQRRNFHARSSGPASKRQPSVLANEQNSRRSLKYSSKYDDRTPKAGPSGKLPPRRGRTPFPGSERLGTSNLLHHIISSRNNSVKSCA
ncbi:hypothetical protein EWB00_000773, partial [Schistosoma japonicum]